MDGRWTEGRSGLAVAMLLLAVMAAVSYLLPLPSYPDGNHGLCFPSPAEWNINPPASLLANYVLLIAAALALIAVNEAYGFIHSSKVVYSSVFLILCGSFPWLTEGVNTSTLLVCGNVAAMWLLFSAEGGRNSSEAMFGLSTIFSFGSMVQYSFALYLPVWLLCAASVKALTFRSFLAYLLGIITPYWILIGFGIITPSSFSQPHIGMLFDNIAGRTDFLLLLIGIGTVAFLFMLLALSNAVRLYGLTARRRAMNGALVILGAGTILLLIFDFNNLLAYVATLCLVFGVQTAHLSNFSRFRHPWIPLAVIAAACIGMLLAFMASSPGWPLSII